MKKIILISVLLLVGIAGFASARLSKARFAGAPHTIIYRVTAYDEAGKVTSINMAVRRVLSDGSWTHTQMLMDGTVKSTNGQLKGVLTERAVDATMKEYLGVRYYEDNNKEAETWISPELQDYLKFTAVGPNGTKAANLEAIEVSTP